MNKKRNDILHDADQISQGEHLAVLSLIPVLKSKSSADHISPRGQPMTSPSSQHREYHLTLVSTQLSSVTKDGIQPYMLSAVPQRPASLSPSYGSRDESRKKKCVQDHSYFEPKTSSKHSLKEAMSPTCFTSSKPETFD